MKNIIKDKMVLLTTDHRPPTTVVLSVNNHPHPFLQVSKCRLCSRYSPGVPRGDYYVTALFPASLQCGNDNRSFSDPWVFLCSIHLFCVTDNSGLYGLLLLHVGGAINDLTLFVEHLRHEGRFYLHLPRVYYKARIVDPAQVYLLRFSWFCRNGWNRRNRRSSRFWRFRYIPLSVRWSDRRLYFEFRDILFHRFWKRDSHGYGRNRLYLREHDIQECPGYRHLHSDLNASVIQVSSFGNQRAFYDPSDLCNYDVSFSHKAPNCGDSVNPDLPNCFKNVSPGVAYCSPLGHQPCLGRIDSP